MFKLTYCIIFVGDVTDEMLTGSGARCTKVNFLSAKILQLKMGINGTLNNNEQMVFQQNEFTSLFRKMSFFFAPAKTPRSHCTQSLIAQMSNYVQQVQSVE